MVRTKQILLHFGAPLLALVGTVLGFGQVAPPANEGPFVGSQACQSCHPKIYERWRKTLMANILVDVKEHPEVIVGDFETPNPLVTFSKDDVVFTYGSKWKQRYFTKIGDDYFVYPAQWDVLNKVWRKYYVEPGTDWWAELYPADQMQRPTGPTCDGCHSTNYQIATKQVTEWNVGCEKCHGAGGDHAGAPARGNIVNPARLDPVRAADVCVQCHSQGQPLERPIDGVYYDWPVGYEPGDRLSDFWALEHHKLGEESFTHFADGSAHKNRMQGNDFVTSVMYTKGVRCWSCHDVHGTDFDADLIKPASLVCLECHSEGSPAGPRGTIEDHTHHAANSAGSECVACHMPKIAKTVADVNVRSHTFRFVSPSMSEGYGVPNPCTSCHSDQSNEWATEQLRGWENFSPWRVAP
ncbi:MAG: cytochrome C [Bryobacterales bacterium]|nr:cytochrome C [Bryobacterales bacterium]